jgi:hypothetical protein
VDRVVETELGQGGDLGAQAAEQPALRDGGELAVADPPVPLGGHVGRRPEEAVRVAHAAAVEGEGVHHGQPVEEMPERLPADLEEPGTVVEEGALEPFRQRLAAVLQRAVDVLLAQGLDADPEAVPCQCGRAFTTERFDTSSPRFDGADGPGVLCRAPLG